MVSPERPPAGTSKGPKDRCNRPLTLGNAVKTIEVPAGTVKLKAPELVLVVLVQNPFGTKQA